MSVTDIAVRSNGATGITAQPGRSTLDETVKLATLLAQSGYFKDAREAAQAVAKIMAGAEMGVGPVGSMTGIHIIEGKPVISAGLMATAVKGSGKYDYRIRTHSDVDCVLEFFQGSESLGVSRFTIEDAKAAGLAGKDVWKKYAKNMLFARALSNGVRFHCPDVFRVGSVYTPEELGAEVDPDGAYVPPALSATPEVAGRQPTEEQEIPQGQPPATDATWNRWNAATEAAAEYEVAYQKPPSHITEPTLIRWCQKLERKVLEATKDIQHESARVAAQEDATHGDFDAVPF